MNIHRITTQNLPSIRVHDHQNSYDSASDLSSQRSLPRDIPFPKHTSPSTSRGGSFHGSVASNVPPLLPVEPLWDGQQIRRKDVNGRRGESNPVSPMETFWNGAGSGRSYWGSQEDNSPSWGNQKLEEEVRSTGNDFKKLNLAERLQSEESLKKEVGASILAYDKHLIRKLTSGMSELSAAAPSSTSISPRTVRSSTFGPDGAPSGTDLEPSRPPMRSVTNPIPIPSLSALEKATDRWPHANLEVVNSRFPMRLEQVPPVLPVLPPSPLEFRSQAPDRRSLSSISHERELHAERIKRPNSVSLHYRSSFDDMRQRSPFSSRRSYDPVGEADTDSQMEDIPSSNVGKMRQLTLETGNSPKPSSYPLVNNQRAGSKRRASSPPSEDRLSNNCDSPRKAFYENGNDLYNRRSPVNPNLPNFRYSPGALSRGHPASALHSSPIPRPGSSYASATSVGTVWSSIGGNSIMSAASACTTHGRNSPATSFSPSSDIDGLSDSPFLTNPSTTHSVPNSRRSSKQRTACDTLVAKQERDNIIPKLSGTQKLSGVFICECCPKKPKKFDTEADLQAHAMEKQYTCAYCNNRFKNKNEAERHQNSLHLRKHSWSCAALSGVEVAFHPSTQRPNQADVCGYCGREFSVPADWAVRVEHLTSEHKFGECNHAKKFFRADHFRQHLKHSHSGTAGKWTNVLENACMRDEQGADGGGGSVELRNAVISEE